MDVVAVLTDSENPRRCWSDLKRKLNSEGASGPYEKIAQLKLLAPDGKRRLTHVADTEQRLKDEKNGRKTYALGRDQPV